MGPEMLVNEMGARAPPKRSVVLIDESICERGPRVFRQGVSHPSILHIIETVSHATRCDSRQGRWADELFGVVLGMSSQGRPRDYRRRIDPAWDQLTLNVANFNPQAVADVVNRCVRNGIVFTTMMELGDPGGSSTSLRTQPDLFSRHPRHGNSPRTPTVLLRRDARAYLQSCDHRDRARRRPMVGMSAASDHRRDGLSQ